MAKKFSYSKLSLYKQCGWKYKLMYVDGHYINEDNISTDFGSLLHHTEELIARSIVANKPIDYSGLIYAFINTDLPDEDVICLNSIKAKYPEKFYEKDKSGRNYQEKADQYLNKAIYRLENFMKSNPDLEIVGIEEQFNIDYEGFRFHGAIDRVFHNKVTDEYIIEDIKSYPEPIRSEDEDLKSPLQFLFYVFAAKELYFIIDESKITCYYDLPLVGIKQQAGSKGFITRGTNKLNKLLFNILHENWKPGPSPLCHWCVFCKHYINKQPEEAKNLCPYFSLWTRENNKDFTSVENEWQGMENHALIMEAFLKKQAQENAPKRKANFGVKIDDPIEIERPVRIRY